MNERLAERMFDQSAQARFATSTGDLNPLHVDAIAARRTQAGAPVVHGMHALLWALDRLVECGYVRSRALRINASFLKFIYVGETACLQIARQTAAKMRLNVVARGLTTVVIDIESIDEPVEDDDYSWEIERTAAPFADRRPRELQLDEIEGHRGRIALNPAGGVSAMFPFATGLFRADTVTGVALLSTVVGMACPGLHSIFAGVSLVLNPSAHITDLHYAVRSVDHRFRLVEILARAPGLFGVLSAFVRQPPVAQPAISSVRPFVSPGEFAGTTALVVGGSRGLGALTARILAAGGAHVVLTYHVGESDARELVEEIGPAHCEMFRFDATADAVAQLASLDLPIDQLYYFATTRIFSSSGAIFSADRFRDFNAIYVSGFERTCMALRSRASNELTAFYPSSIAVSERPKEMTEYAMSKAAGEILCADLNRFLPRFRAVVTRLPRLLTDQTATVNLIESSDPLTTLLPIVREMHESRMPAAT